MPLFFSNFSFIKTVKFIYRYFKKFFKKTQNY